MFNHLFNLFYTFSFLQTNQHTLQENFKRPGRSFVVNWLLDHSRQTIKNKHWLMNNAATMLWRTLLETYFQLTTLQSPGVLRNLKSLAFFLAQTLHNWIRRTMCVVSLLGRGTSFRFSCLFFFHSFLKIIFCHVLDKMYLLSNANSLGPVLSSRIHRLLATCDLVQRQPSQRLPSNIILDHSGLYRYIAVTSPVSMWFPYPNFMTFHLV